MAFNSTSSSSSSPDAEQPTTAKTKVIDSASDDDSDGASSSSASEVGVGAEEDVPVLSHAEQRRQKRKEQKVKKGLVKTPDGDNASPGDKKATKVKNTAELAPSKIPKRQNSVWVGNLSFKTTPDALRQFFDGVGEITRVHMPMKMASAGPNGRGAVKENRGFAYVDFATPEAKTIAVTLSENHLDGRRLLIKDGDDYTGRPSTSIQSLSSDPTFTNADGGDKSLTGHTKTAQKILRQQKQPAGPTLFLGNLSFETTEQGIRSMLESHHSKEVKAEDSMDKWIRKIRMGTFEDTGKCKGWAFVDFLTTDDATTALTNPKNHFLDGRKLVVEYGSPDAVRRGGAGSRGDKGKRERVRPVRKRGIEEDGEGESDSAEKPVKRRRADEEAGESNGPPTRKERKEGRGERPSKVRAKPGAALANAKREAVSIVPSLGKKTVF
ncbi:hypothetical protein BDY19DRAFT_885147 [Irpex rosettiformis]|uniref:Uncharacterized protein n=1 Tax=Irpex rosettiformis TaxID=378272 RepID=A0ACB8UCM5_9APHY|nr:hypothetical protein BDY19DRAFT_885147 [Irpex rosettiformis]